MTRGKNLIAIIVGLFMIINTWTVFILKEKMTNLENEIRWTRNEVSKTNSAVENSRYEIIEKMLKDESLFSFIDTELRYINGQIQATIKVVPKEKFADENIFISLAGKKEEAILTNGTAYTAVFNFPKPETIKPYVSIESARGIKEEVLPEVYIDKLLAIQYESYWGNRDNSSLGNEDILLIDIFCPDEIRNEITNATIIVKDGRTGDEIGKFKALIKKEVETKGLSLEANFKEYSKNAGSYSVFVEIKTEGGILYSDEVAQFSINTGNGSSRISVGGMMYPSW